MIRKMPAIELLKQEPATASIVAAFCSAIDIISRHPRCYSTPNLVQITTHGSRRGGGGGGETSSSSSNAGLTSSNETTSSAEVIRNITELPPVDAFSTSAVLHYCKRKILIPYQRFLSLLGWRCQIPTEDAHFCTLFCVQLHVAVVVLFTLLGYVLQYAACFRRDIVDGYKLFTLETGEGIVDDQIVCKGTVMGLYAIPDLLHFSSYCYTYYLLRICESEQLQILMERVFLQAFYSRSNFITQPKLVRTLRLFLGLSLGWIALSTAIQILHVVAEYPFFTWMQPSLYRLTSMKNIEVVLIVLLVMTMTWNDIIHVTIIMSYSIQCQLLNSFIRGLCERVREKSICLQEAIKEINESSKILKHLNEEFAISVSLMMLHSGVMATSGLIWAFTSGSFGTRDTITLVTNLLSIVMWVLIFAFPLVQAARLSASCHCIKKLGLFLLTRPFGYQEISQTQLDTFLLYTSSIDMQAKLFRVPVRPAFLFAILAFSVFIFLLFSQMEIISFG